MADQQFENTQGLSVNKTFAPASGFGLSWPLLKLKISRPRPATPGVLLNPRDQINFEKIPCNSLRVLFTDTPLYGAALKSGVNDQLGLPKHITGFCELSIGRA
jgi:hypothetical protein